MGADAGAAVDHGTCKDHRAGPDHRFGRHPGGDVDDRGPLAPASRRRAATARRTAGAPPKPSTSVGRSSRRGRRQPSPERVVITDVLDRHPRRRAGARWARVARHSPQIRPSAGRIDDNEGMLAAADNDECLRIHPGTSMGALRGGHDGRHAAMICAARSPACPSSNRASGAGSSRRKSPIECQAQRVGRLPRHQPPRR